MSASREKQNRQELANSGWTDPKIAKEAEQRKKEKRSSALYATIAVVFVIVAAASIIWRTNIIPKMATAATIDGEKYTAAEVSFYYQNAYLNTVNSMSYMLSYIGLDTSSSLRDQTISEDTAAMLPMFGLAEAEAGQTWHDYFMDMALTHMATIQAGLEKAEAEGFVYPAGVQAQFDDSMATLKNSAAASNASVEQLLQSNFGTIMTEEVYSEHLMRMLQYEAYSAAYSDSLTYTDSEITEAYEADPNSYDKAAYEYVIISGSADSTTDAEGNTVEPTEEESAAAMEAAKEAADKMLADYEAGGDLEALAEAYGEDATYTENEAGTYSASVVTEWLFDSARKAGDTAVLESGSSYYVTVFRNRFREEYETIDVRHILFPLGAATLSAEDEGYEDEQAQLKADAKAEADAILAQWQSGEATEESFSALALEHSADGSKYVGGLYSQVYQGQMVDSFEEWCFDASRQSGDTGVVETEYGAHVMYFVGKNLPYWQSMVVSVLKNTDYLEWEESLPADYTITRSDFGMRFVG